jgi:hypothetical protein
MFFAKLSLLSALVSLAQAGPLLDVSAALTPRTSPSFKNTNGIVSSSHLPSFSIFIFY